MRENGYEIMHDAKGHRVLQEDYELIIIHKARAMAAARAQDPFRPRPI